VEHGLATRSHLPVESLFDEIFAWLDGQSVEHRLLGVGIGAPNANHFSGCIEHPPNLIWDRVDLVASVRRHSDLPVAVTNDANAAALGELRFGAARGLRHFVQITLGTGVGSGIVVDGRLLHGHDGFAGEIGHVIAVPDGRPCSCGRRGCLEAYACAAGLVRTARELLEGETGGEILRKSLAVEPSAQQVYEAARRGDRIAREVFDSTGRILGVVLADTVAHLSPEAIVLFGGLAGAGEMLMEPLRRSLEESLMPVFRGKVRLLVSELPGARAAVLGAGALILDQLAAGGGGLAG